MTVYYFEKCGILGLKLKDKQIENL